MDTQKQRTVRVLGQAVPVRHRGGGATRREALAVWCVVVGHSNEDGEAYPSDRRRGKLSGLVDGRNVERGVQSTHGRGNPRSDARTAYIHRVSTDESCRPRRDRRYAVSDADPVTAALPANVTADTRSALTADTRSEQRRTKNRRRRRASARGLPLLFTFIGPGGRGRVFGDPGVPGPSHCAGGWRRCAGARRPGAERRARPRGPAARHRLGCGGMDEGSKVRQAHHGSDAVRQEGGEYIGKATAWAKESGYQSDAEQRADEQGQGGPPGRAAAGVRAGPARSDATTPRSGGNLSENARRDHNHHAQEPAAEDGAGDTPAEDDAQPPADDPARGFDIPESLRERMIPANPADLAGVPLPGAAVPDLRRRRSKGAADDRRAASRDRGPSWRSRPADLPPIHGQDVRVDGAGVARLGGGAGAGPASPSSRQRSGLERLEGRPEPGRAGGAGRGPARVCPLRWRGRRPPGAPHQVAPGRTDYPAGWLRTASRRRGSGTARRSALRPSDRQAHGRIARGSSPPGEPPAGSPPWSERPRGAPAAVVRRDHGAENSTPWSRRVVIARPFGVACGTVTTSFITTSFIGRPDPVAGPGERFALFKWRAIGPAPLAPTIPDAGR